MFLLVVRRSWRNRKPENVQFRDVGPRAKYLWALIPFGIAAVALAGFAYDPGSYLALAEALLWFTIGASMALTPSYGALSESQRQAVSRVVAHRWWWGPTMLVVLGTGFFLLLGFASRGLASLYAMAWLCAGSIWIVWYRITMRRAIKDATD